MNTNRTIALIYSEQDDAMIDGGIKGWITNFHKFLSTLMFQITRENPEIKLISETNFSVSELTDYTVVLIVSTSNLSKSEVIMHGINTYAKSLKENNRLIADGVSRVFKVLKRPYDPD